MDVKPVVALNRHDWTGKGKDRMNKRNEAAARLEEVLGPARCGL